MAPPAKVALYSKTAPLGQHFFFRKGWKQLPFFQKGTILVPLWHCVGSTPDSFSNLFLIFFLKTTPPQQRAPPELLSYGQANSSPRGPFRLPFFSAAVCDYILIILFYLPHATDKQKGCTQQRALSVTSYFFGSKN